jgi:adiponectin receptor
MLLRFVDIIVSADGKELELADSNQIPERWCRRRFDILGASHQIFHLMVVLAALTYTQGILQAFDFVHENDHTCGLQSIG